MWAFCNDTCNIKWHILDSWYKNCSSLREREREREDKHCEKVDIYLPIVRGIDMYTAQGTSVYSVGAPPPPWSGLELMTYGTHFPSSELPSRLPLGHLGKTKKSCSWRRKKHSTQCSLHTVIWDTSKLQLNIRFSKQHASSPRRTIKL